MSKTEIREALAMKREAVHRFFEQAKDGDRLDFSKVSEVSGTNEEKLAWFRERDAELNELQEKYEEILGIEHAADENERQRKWLTMPAGGMTHPGGGTIPGGFDSNSNPFAGKSIGRLFTESEAFKGYQPSAKRSPVVELALDEDSFSKMWAAAMGINPLQAKALVDETAFAPQAVRTGLILPGALRRPVVADLIPQATTSQIAIVYMEETTTTNAAAAVAEGGTKPESALVFTERSSAVRKLATVLPVTDELFQDEPAMRGYVEARLRLFMQLTEETQLISGNGTAPNLRGMMNVVGIQTQAKGTDPTPDAIYKAMVLIQTNAFLDPSGVIIHPLDWQDVRLLRTADGLYIWGSPSEAGPERIWGLPCVVTPAATQNTAIVAAFDTAMQIFRRAEVSFAVSDQHNDFFITNKLMLRVEERLAFPVYRPLGICTVTGI